MGKIRRRGAPNKWCNNKFNKGDRSAATKGEKAAIMRTRQWENNMMMSSAQSPLVSVNEDYRRL